MSLTLGTRHLSMTLSLTEGADFTCTLVSEDGDWPATAVIGIKVGDTTWAAALAGTEATFSVDKAQVQAVIDSGARYFRLICTDGTYDAVWGQGSISVTREPTYA